MAYLKQQKTERLTLPSDPEYWVEMKLRASHGDVTAAQNAMLQVTQVQTASLPNGKRGQVLGDPQSGVGVLTEFEIQAYFSTLVARLITDWNLTDELERPLPVNRKSIELLEAEDGDFLQKAAQKRLPGRPTEVERPFEKPSPSPSATEAAG